MANRHVKRTLNITNHLGDANQNYSEMSLHAHLFYHKIAGIKTNSTSVVKDVEKLEPFALLGIKSGAAAVENSVAPPQKVKQRITM